MSVGESPFTTTSLSMPDLDHQGGGPDGPSTAGAAWGRRPSTCVTIEQAIRPLRDVSSNAVTLGTSSSFRCRFETCQVDFAEVGARRTRNCAQTNWTFCSLE